MPAGASPARAGDPSAAPAGGSLRSRAADVQRGPLVRVLPVTQCLAPGPQRRGHIRPAGLLGRLVRRISGGEPGGHCAVVRGGVGVGPGGQPAPLLQGEPAVRHRRRDVPVPGRVGDDRDMLMVLGGRPDHGRTADVDLLDALGRGSPAAHRRLERVQVGHQQLERRDAQLVQPGPVGGPAQVGEQPGVHRRVQRLDPPVERLREPGEILHPGHGDTYGADRVRGAAGADDLHARGVQRACQLAEPRLVVHADQRAPDRYPRQRLVLTFTARSLPSGPPWPSRRGPSGPQSPRAGPAQSP